MSLVRKLSEYCTLDGWKTDWKETRARHPSLDKLVSGAMEVYRNNRIVNVNANVLLASYPGIEAAAQMSGAMERLGSPEETTALVAAAVDWLVYVPVHLALHYAANKERFVEGGRFSAKKLLKDAAHVYLTQIPSILAFYALAGPLHYALMDGVRMGERLYSCTASAANRISYWTTLVATRTLHTAIGLKTGLFKNDAS